MARQNVTTLARPGERQRWAKHCVAAYRAVANYSSNTVSVRLNDGTGNFTAPATNPNPAVVANPFSVALGDVDGAYFCVPPAGAPWGAGRAASLHSPLYAV